MPFIVHRIFFFKRAIILKNIQKSLLKEKIWLPKILFGSKFSLKKLMEEKFYKKKNFDWKQNFLFE